MFNVLLPLPLLLLALPSVVQAEDYTYTTNAGTISITGYTGPGGVVNIPSTINGLPVTSIGNHAFSDCTNLINVTIPNSVSNIGDGAFRGCTSLTYATIGNSVTSIGYWAFENCTTLTNVTIPDSVTSIEFAAFAGCTSLTSVTIGSSVTNIGYSWAAFVTFSGCSSLTAITVNTNNPAYSSGDGGLFDKSQTMLIRCPQGKAGNYIIPDSVTSIGNNAFLGCANLTSVTIPNRVSRIEGGTFMHCTGLTSITIPDSVTSIGGGGPFFTGAFWGCTSLTNVILGNMVTSIESCAFSDCYSLTSVAIGNSVTNIGDYAFSWSGLTSVTIPNSVNTIGGWAFMNCYNLAGVYFQGNAPSVGSSAFDGADAATVYYLPGTTGWGPTFGDRPTALWVLPDPLILNSSSSFGVQTNRFGFLISWGTNLFVVVETCTDLANPIWFSVGTNTLTGGSSYFSDPQWTNHPARFYRLRSP